MAPPALAITIGLAACGGSSSSGPTPAAYVKSICQAIGPFEKTVQKRSSALNLSTIRARPRARRRCRAS